MSSRSRDSTRHEAVAMCQPLAIRFTTERLRRRRARRPGAQAARTRPNAAVVRCVHP
jgi:hypothetical protein